MTAPAPSSAPPELRRAEVRLANGLRLSYTERGPLNGRPVLLLHGYTDSGFSFSRILPLLPADCRLIAPDQRGHGDSDRPPAGYTIDQFAEDGLQLLDALGITRAAVIGHSMGSFIARRMAILAPERVQSLVLIGSALTPRTRSVTELLQAVDDLVDPVPEEFIREFQISTIECPVPVAFLETVIAESKKLTASVWKLALAGLFHADTCSGLEDLQCPTLIVGGDRDAVFHEGSQRLLAQAIPGSEIEILPDVGHAPHWEVPHQFASLVSRRI